MGFWISRNLAVSDDFLVWESLRSLGSGKSGGLDFWALGISVSGDIGAFGNLAASRDFCTKSGGL